MKAIILAAGKGLRMEDLTKEKPKALIEFNGTSLLEQVLNNAIDAGINEFVIVIGYKGKMIQKKIGSKFKEKKITYVWQQQQLGTGHAVLQAKNVSGEKFCVLNCDVIFDSNDLKTILKKNNFDAVILAREDEKPQNFGVLSVKNEKLLKITEKPINPIGNLVNAGVYFFTDYIFEKLEKSKKSKRNEFEITDAINEIASEGKASYILAKGKIFDIGKKSDL